jgi:integrase
MGLMVHTIETAHVMSVVKPIWKDKRVTAERVRKRIETVLGWAKSAGLRSGDNPAQWKDHLKNLLSNDKVERENMKALPYAEIADFVLKLRGSDLVQARLQEFAILTATRSTEARCSRWPEIDEAARTWTIPAERMKGRKGKRRVHVVPLSDAAMAVLDKMSAARRSDFVFPGATADVVNTNAANLLVKSINENADPHGFRATFRTWASECTSAEHEVKEKALAHTVGDETERAYNRGGLLEKRRALMDAWARFCNGETAVDNIVKFAHAA